MYGILFRVTIAAHYFNTGGPMREPTTCYAIYFSRGNEIKHMVNHFMFDNLDVVLPT